MVNPQQCPQFHFPSGIAQQDDLKHGTELVSLLTEAENQEIKDIKMSLSMWCK
jgi:hypothetical protein